mmetsp:Transcript_24790/g.44772  ORF Transcript_24790/g.44772 Transcript_24790/m.44772 type:complete len:282 (+) Transcript_24790:592-1437(+)
MVLLEHEQHAVVILPRSIVLIVWEHAELEPERDELVEFGDRVLGEVLRSRLPVVVQSAHFGGPSAQIGAVFVVVIDVEVAGVGLEGLELYEALFPGNFRDQGDVARAGPAAAFGALEFEVDALEFFHSIGIEFGGCSLLVGPVLIMKPRNPLVKLVPLHNLLAISHPISIGIIVLLPQRTRHIKVPMIPPKLHQLLKSIVPAHGRILPHVELVPYLLHPRRLGRHELGILLPVQGALVVEPLAEGFGAGHLVRAVFLAPLLELLEAFVPRFGLGFGFGHGP